jgi:hypothetical protein
MLVEDLLAINILLSRILAALDVSVELDSQEVVVVLPLGPVNVEHL